MPSKISDAAPAVPGQTNAPGAAAPTVQLGDEQFDRLVELLTPGYQLAKFYLAEFERQKAAREAEEKAQREVEEKAAEAAKAPKG